MASTHVEGLRKFCRLCGLQRALSANRKPVEKKKKAKQINKICNVKLEEDAEDIHPPYICDTCRRRLDRKAKIELFEFQACVGTSCSICVDSDPNSTVEKVQEEVAVSLGFSVVAGENDDFRFVKLRVNSDIVERSVTVGKDGQWEVKLLGKTIANRECLGLPSQFTAEVLHKVASLKLCTGNVEYGELLKDREERGTSFPSGHVCEGQLTVNGKTYEKTVRHKNCVMWCEIPNRNQCNACHMYRSDLSSMTTQMRHRKLNPFDLSASSKVRNDLLSPSEVQIKLKNVQQARQSEKRKRYKLQDKLLEREGIDLDEEQAEEMKELAEAVEGDMKECMPEDSYQRLLWEEQLKMSKMKDARSMRWHPAVIKWCVALHAKSPAAYKMIRKSNFLKLPHQTTLNCYTDFTECMEGYNLALLDRIWKDSNLQNEKQFKRNVSLLYDEMKIKSGLVFNQRTGRMMGFVNLGSLNTEMGSFGARMEELDSGKPATPEIATHVLAFMVRGICSPLRAAFGFFPCRGVTTSELCWCVWEGVKLLEETGFKVRALVSDGASCNRKLYRISKSPDIGKDEPPYYCQNPVCPERRIYFICDPPHLMKTTRNCWENSGFHNKTRNMMYNKLEIKWKHLLDLYDWDNSENATYRRLHKITDDHLFLTSTLRMKVNLAVQVLSTTVANAFKSKGDPLTKSTEKFVSYMDKFFDCLNVRNARAGWRDRKLVLEPYYDSDDPRLKWLMEDFLGFLNEWEAECLAAENISLQEKRKMCLSVETLEGLRITVFAFVALAKELFSDPEVDFLLSEKLNQDPVEEHFSKQRRAGGSNEAPDISQVLHRSLQFHVAGTSARGSTAGNSMPATDVPGIDNTPLPRRPTKK